jgi:hypothetical protein
MADISPVRRKIQVEEVQAFASVSSSTGNRIGASANFILERLKIHRNWQINGRYGRNVAAQSEIDGGIPLEEDLEIVGFYMNNQIAGASGITEIDIRRRVASGTTGTSIFTTRPSISFAAGDNAKLQVGLSPSETLHNPAGTVLPVFSGVNLNKGDDLFLDFVSKQLGAESLTVTLILRPR